MNPKRLTMPAEACNVINIRRRFDLKPLDGLRRTTVYLS